MNKFIDSVYKIHNNPFVLTPLIVTFYEKLEKKPNNILFAYLVLPLVLNERSKLTLQTARTTSSIHTFIDSSDKSKRENVFGLPERIQNYKLTLRTLQLLKLQISHPICSNKKFCSHSEVIKMVFDF
ncbi:MAG: three component ABC system middle component [Sulfuricurvum sp.]